MATQTPLPYFTSLSSLNSTVNVSSGDAAAYYTSRTIWGILASCGLTLFVCMWYAVQPALHLPPVKWYTIVITRFNLTFFALSCPAYVIADAGQEWCEARQHTKHMHERGYKWWTMTHSHFMKNGGFVLWDNSSLREIWHNELLQLLDANELANPVVAEADIKDKSNFDGLAVTVIILQLFWFMMQVITRLANHLTVTLVELDTVCAVILSLPLFLFGWNKPFCATRPYVLYKRDAMPLGGPAVSPKDEDLEKSEPVNYDIENITVKTGRMSGYPSSPKPNPDHMTNVIERCSFFCPYIVIGALHLAAWNYEFPTRAEMILWRTASLGLLASPGVLLSIDFISQHYLSGDLPMLVFHVLGALVLLISPPLLIALMFASLRSLPTSAYDVIPWTMYVPHL